MKASITRNTKIRRRITVTRTPNIYKYLLDINMNQSHHSSPQIEWTLSDIYKSRRQRGVRTECCDVIIIEMIRCSRNKITCSNRLRLWNFSVANWTILYLTALCYKSQPKSRIQLLCQAKYQTRFILRSKITLLSHYTVSICQLPLHRLVAMHQHTKCDYRMIRSSCQSHTHYMIYTLPESLALKLLGEKKKILPNISHNVQPGNDALMYGVWL